MARVVFVTTILTEYRVPFHEKVRANLAAQGVEYELLYGQPDPGERQRAHCANVAWGKNFINRYLAIGPLSLVWQGVLRDVFDSDLAVFTQESRLLVNYFVQLTPSFMRPRFAYWGHGRNFQAASEKGFLYNWKRFWAIRCDWWFAYTTETRRILEAYGFPPERITVFNNTVDTTEVQQYASAITDAELAELRKRLKIEPGAIGVFVGGLYDRKRIEFLIQSAIQIRKRVPSFTLLVVGGGVDRDRVEAAAAAHSWIRYLGPRFGREKVALLKLGHVLLMPGLVGLSLLDSAAAGVPIITTNYPYHSPEIAYLQPGRNGLIVADWQNTTAYAEAVVSVLLDEGLHTRLARGAHETAKLYTIEEMVNRFCDGVLSALSLRTKEHKCHTAT
jgi:glycosyltransferase involved in cell wall biosynthesis